MGTFDKIIRPIAEKLYEDESLRSNLNDAEAKIVLDWALARITKQVNTARDDAAAKQIMQSELARVRSIVTTINASAKNPGALDLANLVATLDAQLSGGKRLTPEDVLALVETSTSQAKKMKAKKS